jgi:hypothetical protein
VRDFKIILGATENLLYNHTVTSILQSTTWVKKESEIEAAKAALLNKDNDPFKKMLSFKNGDFLKKFQDCTKKHADDIKTRQKNFVSNFKPFAKFKSVKGV